MIEYRTKAGLTSYKPELGLDVGLSDLEDGLGWCLGCGNSQEGVEPDARGYECDECGAHRVYGLAELALMGLIGGGYREGLED